MSTREAARRLGVSQRQVQRLVGNGTLSGYRTAAGNSLVVDPLSVSALQRRSVSQGRPWSPGVAWGALWMLSGLAASWLTESQLSRTVARLSSIRPEALVDATRQRAVVVRYRGGQTALDHSFEFLVLTGSSAQSASRVNLSAQRAADGYCLSATEREYSHKYGLLLDRLGQITVRIPSLDEVITDRREMPIAVVAVDLASSYESRDREAGLKMLSELLREVQ